jgi:hypothetical protein
MSTRETVDRFRLKSHALAGVYHKTGNLAYAALAGACHEAADELDRLSAQNQRLREALINYAVHARGCIPQVACTCGLSAAMKDTP